MNINNSQYVYSWLLITSSFNTQSHQIHFIFFRVSLFAYCMYFKTIYNISKDT